MVYVKAVLCNTASHLISHYTLLHFFVALKRVFFGSSYKGFFMKGDSICELLKAHQQIRVLHFALFSTKTRQCNHGQIPFELRGASVEFGFAGRSQTFDVVCVNPGDWIRKEQRMGHNFVGVPNCCK